MSDVSERARQSAAEFFGGFRRQLSRLWIVGAAICMTGIALKTCSEIEPGQVAVRVNNLTGNVETLTRPGLIFDLPFGIHDVFLIDTSSQTFHMKGEKNLDDLNVKELRVRASDGSEFVFNDTTILYRAIPARGAEVIRDAGYDHGFRMWMLPYARSILRDEFGRESTISVSDPSHFGEATSRAKERLNALLNVHGIEITSIVTPRPRFNNDYESLVESRNETENQMSVISSELQRAETERARQLAEVDRDQNKLIQEKRAALEAQLATAVTTQTQTKRETDSYKIEQIAAGQAALSGHTRRAQELKGQLDAQYLARKAAIDAFRNQPVERVMERLGERLEGVTIEIQPWTNDSSPARVQYEQMGAPR
jgi:membrane protease subunit HflC